METLERGGGGVVRPNPPPPEPPWLHACGMQGYSVALHKVVLTLEVHAISWLF